ncbi:MarR family winged helix-turn-helix transcriptional regulator [Brevundimonas sp.]|jgi:DNA-binding MarR family transcriptional regulator|uniref:MarR family winged helix-turn-helix transcriptional regulator n=1 Tax=Brevundimonas sp. TaxID=1871086 RepID=UPI003783B3A7
MNAHVPSDLSLDDHLCFALYAASMSVNRLYKPLLDGLGITYPQYLVLGALREGEVLTIGGLATRLSLEPSTITPLVKRLEVAGLVIRRRNQDDEREVRVSLTDQGRELLAQTHCLAQAMVTRSGLAPAELAELTTIVRDFSERLKAG